MALVNLLAAKLILALIMVGSGGLLIYVARATASGRIGRNAYFGIRTTATMNSDDAWLAAHRAGRTPTEAAGWCSAAIGGLLILVWSPAQLAIVCGIGAVGMLVLTIWGAVRGVRAAKSTSGADQ